MENYDIISVAGEGSYGIVMKCKNKQTKKVVAIKKLLDIEKDRYAKKMAFREIRILRKLQHENLVKLLEVLRKKKRFYLVFEYLDRTVLDDIEDHPNGLGEKRTRDYMCQLLRGIEYCHNKNVIHRDIKPENLLVSKCGILKLCDFGFARVLNTLQGSHTEYIATRWYRAPELLVRDKNYGRPVDIWAIGCVFAELLSGEPLFPGDSDIDQLFQITKRFGKLCSRHLQLLNTLNKQNELEETGIKTFEAQTMNNVHALHNLFPTWSTLSLNIVAICLHLDPNKRPTATELLRHEYFNENNFKETYYSSSISKRRKTPGKSSITIEFNRELCGSSGSTPRVVNNIQKPPISFTNFQSTVRNISSPNALKFNTFGNHVHGIDKVNDIGASLNFHKLIPFHVEHAYTDDWHKNADNTVPLNLRWPEFVPDSKSNNPNQKTEIWREHTGREMRELQKSEETLMKKTVGFGNRKNRFSKISEAEFNLPFLHSK